MASFTGITSQLAPLRRQQTAQGVYLLDQLLGLALLFTLAPVILISALITWRLSRQSPFVAHQRVGQYGEAFWILKLRTMWSKADDRRARALVQPVTEQPAGPGKNACDDRVSSRYARFCRRYSIDELPQLWHVVCGEMALIGPRPITQMELATHYGESAQEVLRLRPGLSGLWQVLGRSRLNYPQRRRLDLFLVRHFSAGLYLRTLWRTIPAAVRGVNAW